MQSFDITVIGAGPGGYVAAIHAAQKGAKTALIEATFFGGTCLNWGCIPTKSLIASADMLATMQHAADFGITTSGTPTPDWAKMIERKNTIVTNLRNGIASLLKRNGVTVFDGTGSFENRKTIRIEKDCKTVETIESATTIIATGSQSVKPSIVPDADTIFYSREFLDMPSLPDSILILGGGVIGCEFACMLARLGVDVTLVEMLPTILPMADTETAKVVAKSMKKLGVEIHSGTPMTDITATKKQVSGKVGDTTLSAPAMLVCVGRNPYLDGLNLAAAGLETNDNGTLTVNDKCKTRAPGIYAVGDVTDGPQYAHRASAMGIAAVNNALGNTDTHSDALVPGCIFTHPEIGSVGLNEEEAKETGRSIRIGKFPFAALGKAQIHGETDGLCKIIADAETDQIVGVHIVGPHATDLIAEAATAMNLEITAKELGKAMHAHPTLGEVTMEAAHDVGDQCIHIPPKRQKHG